MNGPDLLGFAMRKIAISAIAIAALIGAPAFAANMAVKAPPPVPAPVYSWTGFYVGLNAGYNSTRGSVDTTASPGPFAISFDPESNAAAAQGTTSLDPRGRGFIGGGQIGYNWQFAPQWVGGLEADIQALSNGNSSATVTTTSVVPVVPPETFVSTSMATRKVDWLGTARARLGFLVTPSLLTYGTGGLAYGHVKASTSITQGDFGIGGFGCSPTLCSATAATTGEFGETRAGWTLGGGLEWMFAPNWSLKAEYLHYDLGHVSWGSPNLVFNVPPFASPTFSAVNIISSTHVSGDVVRGGLNYQFH